MLSSCDRLGGGSVQIAALLFPDVTALDIVGPYEVLQRLPDASVVFVGHEVGVVRADNQFLGLAVDATFEDVTHPDIVIVPGGPGTERLSADGDVLAWIRKVHPSTRFTTSVCTGALVLGAAGLLNGLRATTHWGQLDLLNGFGAIPTQQRIVEHLDERIITAAGVSAGIDMALRLCELVADAVAAQAMQLFIEYDPQPPHPYTPPASASPDMFERLIAYAAPKA
ncbi:MAG: DJ-1/PfpI family protein [Acidimicrobiales bacterium]